MKKSLILLALVFVITCLTSPVDNLSAQTTKLTPRTVTIRTDLTLICMKPDLTFWKGWKLGPSGDNEFPWSYTCASELEKVGVHKMPIFAVWITNAGKTKAPATKARFTYFNGIYPHGLVTIYVSVPALDPGANYYLKINPGSNKYFLLGKSVAITLDYNNQVDECKEDNNASTFTYPG